MGLGFFAPSQHQQQQGIHDSLLIEADLFGKPSETSLGNVEDGHKPTRPVSTFGQRVIVAILFLAAFIGALKYMSSASLMGIIASLSTSDSSSLSAAFNRKCEALLTPPPKTYSNRLDSLVSELPQSTVWIAEPGPSASYFIGGFSTQDWWLSERPFFVAIGRFSQGSPRIFLVTPEFEALRASLIELPKDLDGLVTWVKWREDQSPYEALKAALDDEINAFVLDGLTRQFVAEGLRNVLREEKNYEVLEKIGLIRERKSHWEVGLLRCANQKTLHAIRKTRKRMHLGISESKTSRILEEEMAKTGLMGGEGLVLFGENAALPHGSGTDRKLIKSEMVLIDAGGKWGGYVSDITRTFALANSKIPLSHIEIWEAVHKAQHAPYAYLKTTNTTIPATFAQLDKAARSAIDSWAGSTAGTDIPNFDIFTHRLGHGIGIEGHESPYLIQGSLGERQVRSGHVFSLEPGIYLPINGKPVNGINGVGVRLEDCFVVTEDEDGGFKGEWLSGPVQSWGDV